ncbi:hypothetical protein CRENBAI_001943 [Crenichthys baileyi]|uniref:Laminin EGF-like domain-containing protein n=1 Tax=Crenichthys baileyi TaxID=28760 RepID=A0AAV9RZC8_9TELE
MSQCPAINPAIQLPGRRETKKQAFSSQEERTPGKEEEIGKDGAVWTVVGEEESRGRRQSQNALTERQIQYAQTTFLCLVDAEMLIHVQGCSVAEARRVLGDDSSSDMSCENCAPLYNDKPFRSGNQLQPMNCRLCLCYGHAISCHYDVQADEHPDEHYRGGGGVCDHCMHNTTGKNCELCISGFFRQEDSDPTSVHVCQPCNCNTAGTVKGNTECAQIGGQCNCKAAVTGRNCSYCLPGWYGLSAPNPNGCTSCNCSDQGTVSTSSTGAVSICNQYTGQCQCKLHVTGLSCDRCEFGYWNLSHPDGCIPCNCDPLGSLSSFCEPDGGQCECKPGVGGRQCDSCSRGLYGLRLEGSCAPCNCSHDGTVPGTNCDPYTGQCVCKGCVPCICDPKGTVTGSTCDTVPNGGKPFFVPITHMEKDCSTADSRASTSLQITACVWSVTAILWEQFSLVVRARMDSVSVLIPQWEEGAVTNVVRCSLDSTLVWEADPTHHQVVISGQLSPSLHPSVQNMRPKV